MDNCPFHNPVACNSDVDQNLCCRPHVCHRCAVHGLACPIMNDFISIAIQLNSMTEYERTGFFECGLSRMFDNETRGNPRINCKALSVMCLDVIFYFLPQAIAFGIFNAAKNKNRIYEHGAII